MNNARLMFIVICVVFLCGCQRNYSNPNPSPPVPLPPVYIAPNLWNDTYATDFSNDIEWQVYVTTKPNVISGQSHIFSISIINYGHYVVSDDFDDYLLYVDTTSPNSIVSDFMYDFSYSYTPIYTVLNGTNTGEPAQYLVVSMCDPYDFYCPYEEGTAVVGFYMWFQVKGTVHAWKDCDGNDVTVLPDRTITHYHKQTACSPYFNGHTSCASFAALPGLPNAASGDPNYFMCGTSVQVMDKYTRRIRESGLWEAGPGPIPDTYWQTGSISLDRYDHGIDLTDDLWSKFLISGESYYLGLRCEISPSDIRNVTCGGPYPGGTAKGSYDVYWRFGDSGTRAVNDVLTVQ